VSRLTRLVTALAFVCNVNLYLCAFTVCREWLVHEDGALAYRLQDEESMYKFFLIYIYICYMDVHTSYKDC